MNIDNIIENAGIPKSCNNFTDVAIYANRSIQDYFNELNYGFLMDEFNMYKAITEGVEILNEDSKIKEIKDKIIGGLKKLLEIVTGFFGKIAKNIKYLFSTMKKQVFSMATKSEFDKAVNFFKTYKGDPVVFINDSEKSNEHVKLFLGKKSFIDEADRYNKEILNRSREMFNSLKDLYTKADFDRASSVIGPYFGKAVADKDNAIKILSNSISSTVYRYAMLGKNDGDGTFTADDAKVTIFNHFANLTFQRTQVDSNNITNFADDISEIVYGNSGNKWTSTVQQSYSELKKMIEDAIRPFEGATFVKTDNNLDEFEKSANNTHNKFFKGTRFAGDVFITKYALDFTNRCKDIIQVLLTIESAMNAQINGIYRNDVKLVIVVLNKYWKLNKEKKEVTISALQLDRLTPETA